ncbi:hypothetical protein RFI_23779 [Reticulomyxa filosa]|uniref:Uncharacterized protein n=1 Tax=Reticulomyxa filosa TaxID=46433 RepID=X6MHU6_RETFI|nr:hypothetical protein RFI_23779 [Reticulomyxa filosa]|eukprot:ETO13588.1 hypothetical protein RFI_23779 [Reticulomyxa filosa]
MSVGDDNSILKPNSSALDVTFGNTTQIFKVYPNWVFDMDISLDENINVVKYFITTTTTSDQTLTKINDIICEWIDAIKEYKKKKLQIHNLYINKICEFISGKIKGKAIYANFMMSTIKNILLGDKNPVCIIITRNKETKKKKKNSI